MESTECTKFNPLDHPICFETPLRIQGALPWAEHIPFAMYLISAFKPKTIVELGTYTGNSYCAFCQAVKTIGLDTKCYAVDTWKGDEHSGFYDDEIYTELSEYHDPLYSGFSRLLRMTFDDAVNYFSDGYIDLLHIDGLHTYEAVKHDFENWRPKLNEQSIVLFHDINVREREFGVWKFWEELKQEFQWFEFFHGNGLGVISLSETHNDVLSSLFHANEVEAQLIRIFFSNLGKNVLRIRQTGFKSQVDELERSIGELNKASALKDNQIEELEKSIGELNNTSASKDNQIEELEKSIGELNNASALKDNQIEELEKSIGELNNASALKDNQIEELEKSIGELNNASALKDSRIEELERSIDELNRTSALKDSRIEELERSIGELNRTSALKDDQIFQQQNELVNFSLSSSWRLTRPLRKLKDLLRKIQ